MTPSQLAISLVGIRTITAMSGVDRRLIQRIKAGTVTPHQATADRIAEARRRYLREKLSRRLGEGFS